MGERIQIKVLADGPDGPDAPGVIRETAAPDWPTGLKVAAAVIRKLTPPKDFARDEATQALVAKWESSPEDVKRPFAFFACGGFAVQVRIIDGGAP